MTALTWDMLEWDRTLLYLVPTLSAVAGLTTGIAGLGGAIVMTSLWQFVSAVLDIPELEKLDLLVLILTLQQANTVIGYAMSEWRTWRRHACMGVSYATVTMCFSPLGTYLRETVDPHLVQVIISWILLLFVGWRCPIPAPIRGCCYPQPAPEKGSLPESKGLAGMTDAIDNNSNTNSNSNSSNRKGCTSAASSVSTSPNSSDPKMPVPEVCGHSQVRPGDISGKSDSEKERSNSNITTNNTDIRKVHNHENECDEPAAATPMPTPAIAQHHHQAAQSQNPSPASASASSSSSPSKRKHPCKVEATATNEEEAAQLQLAEEDELALEEGAASKGQSQNFDGLRAGDTASSRDLGKVEPAFDINQIKWWLILSGIPSGILNGMCGLGGPPYIILMTIYRVPKSITRPLFPLNIIFELPLRFVLLLRQRTVESLWADSHILLFTLVANFTFLCIGSRLSKRVSQQLFERVLFAVLLLSSVVALGLFQASPMAFGALVLVAVILTIRARRGL
mmetsp:Transcript_39636/g.84688  ORF Transcript_39636/g.84688 Transcript_39636/m.84688 type:complete len:509 (-) Transcript_39636:293-1819(-)|eukprot:CAMPEP_0206430268 /NCGR_PEP_ID=MMETSP0324_2-20121206/6722_1 /ASSEMBLY_ACC=CAM_ASM_000836 /TAXON_ID=2866 /ORGANISM="Crypthecodinium cohnii, Strain Seligo" /LENGTH=508 /DNA_ID=CAMNT_0053896081 /DNA_START=259 /DNA_END=1785 /DNA_ORIENTATION=+